MTWHLLATTLQEYADERVPAPVAWSVETHLVECRRCREVLARLVSAEDAALLGQVRSAVRLPSRPAPARSPRSAIAEGVLGPWWAWSSLVVAVGAVLTVMGRLPVPNEPRSAGLTWLVALSPVVPVAMVAAVYAMADRDETTRVTPRGGLELVLYRTAAALLLAVPAVTVGLWASGALTVVWLLPGLALCIGALVLGSWIGVEQAALGLCSVWALAVGLTMTPRSPLVADAVWLVSPSGAAVAWWCFAIAAGSIALLLRQDRFDTPRGLR